MTGPIVLQQTRFADVPESQKAQVNACDGMTFAAERGAVSAVHGAC
ncbi:hypothetical protein J7E87_22780 [Streptomyces sp. ISL-1]|nr:hypothetical protein [Streptomyces sp. ISL-1]MBT2392175.1 hypothetical protein [Streptomyces sp. ISL-1]